MNAININKEKLLETLRVNREKHREIFLEAQDGYRKQCVSELDSMLKDARDGKKIRRSVTLVEPMDQTSDYDAAIAMLEMSVDEKILLEPEDFRCYVLDQWRWKQQWTSSNNSYSEKLRSMNP